MGDWPWDLVDGRIAIVNGREDGKIIEPKKGARCPTAMDTDSDNDLFVTHGSSTNNYNEWKRDLMEKNSSGSVWRVEISTGMQTKLCGGLAFPYGVYHDDKAIVVAESWRSRLLKIALDGSSPPDGDYWANTWICLPDDPGSEGTAFG